MTSPKINWISPGDFAGFPPRRAPDTHKGTYGHLMVVAGSLGYHGAAVLTVRGAQRAQPGLVTLLTQESIYYPVAAQLQSAMVNLWTPDFNRFAPAGAVLMGPGLAAPDLGDDFKTVLRRLWRDATVPMVVDASALAWLSPQTTANNAVRVITPHPGEAAALLKQPVAQVQADREAALRELSRRNGNCWVVLKGHHTLIGRAEGDLWANPSGNPHLAQGGSGDVLSGFIAGLLVQPALQADPGRTLRYAVWQHGAAADRLQAARKNWIVEDLVNELGAAV
jgi:NAD(P)H-hydrate epimerase